ncbi:MAG: UPF0280 family protein [Candidatus Bathyarchaeota archaeon]|nr:UPF0280 family protein [Candidatus Bathyarchaeum sp.]
MTKQHLIKEAFRLKESNCTIISDQKSGIEKAKSSIKHHRKQLETYVNEHPQFLHSFEPVPVGRAPKVAQLMAEASAKANVGPMAAVAGVLADLAVQEMIDSGCKVAVMENGGEVSAVSDQPIDIGFQAGDEPLSREMGFRLTKFPVGVATSSGRFSHAFSFGDADAVTIFAVDAGVADAAATAVANLTKGDDVPDAIRQGIDDALSIDGVQGVFILYRGVVGRAGQVPELIKVNPKQ